MPGVNELPVCAEPPDPMVMNNGAKVTTPEQWKKRREEIKRALEYYAVGEMPPPPGNVKGVEVTNETVLDGKVKYRLVHLTFGPKKNALTEHRHLHAGHRRAVPNDYFARPGRRPMRRHWPGYRTVPTRGAERTF